MSMKDELLNAMQLVNKAADVLAECKAHLEELEKSIEPEECPCICETFPMAKELGLIDNSFGMKDWMDYCTVYRSTCHIKASELFDYPINKFIEAMTWDAVLKFCNEHEPDITSRLNFIEKYFPNAAGQYWYIDKDVLAKELANNNSVSVALLKEVKQ